MYKCCIFDLDGTLVNSIYALKRSVDLTLGHFGLGPVSIKDTKQFVGDGYKKYKLMRAFLNFWTF